jgi:hypothetical protein
MNIENLLDLGAGISASGTDGKRVSGKITQLEEEEDFFIFAPDSGLEVVQGGILKITDGTDSVLAKVVEHTDAGYRLCMDAICPRVMKDARMSGSMTRFTPCA